MDRLTRLTWDDPAFPENPTFHPLANIFPLLGGDAYAALVADIKANGLMTPIVERDGVILDGRNRYIACKEAGVPIRTERFAGADVLAFVLSANLQRRHLNESARAMVAAKLASQRGAKIRLSLAEAAGMLRVSERSVDFASKVRIKATARLIERAEAGEIAVSLAASLADLTKAQQHAIEDADEAVLRGAAKKAKRSARERSLAEQTTAASKAIGTRLYSVIYADPPWRFEAFSQVTGMDRAADNHYPTMTLEELCAIVPPAAKDCVLFMWVTPPVLEQSFEVLRAWGFTYKSHFVWSKDRAGTGYWVRNRHELLLIATRGTVPAPAPGEQFESVIGARVGAHSEKPIAFAEAIEEMFPSARPIEMFARTRRAGWDAWGNEVALAS